MSSSITTHLTSLHSLPVKVRGTYKIACLCYHSHSSTAPSYMADILHKKPSHTPNTLSSSYSMPLLNGSTHSKVTLGDRSFSFASSSVRNIIQMMSGVPHHVIIYVPFEDILVSFSFHRLNFLFDHHKYVHGLALLLLC